MHINQKQYLGNTINNVYIQKTPDHTKTVSPPHLEIDFLLDSGATLHVINNDTWNEIKEYQKHQHLKHQYLISQHQIILNYNQMAQ